MRLIKPRRGVVMRHYRSDADVPTAIAAAVLVVLAGASVLMWPTLRTRSGAQSAAADLPAGIAGLLGLTPQQSLDTAAGHLGATFFAFVLPIVLVALMVPLAAASIARPAERNELEFMAGQALSHRQLEIERFMAVVVVGLQAMTPALILIVVATQIGNFDIGPVSLVLAALRALAVATLAAAVASVVSTLARRTVIAMAAGVGFTVALFGLIAANDNTAVASPAHWALTAAAAGGGSPVGAAAVAVVAMAVVVAASIRFERGDLIR